MRWCLLLLAGCSAAKVPPARHAHVVSIPVLLREEPEGTLLFCTDGWEEIRNRDGSMLSTVFVKAPAAPELIDRMRHSVHCEKEMR